MTDTTPQIVTIKTVYDEVQGLKKFMYRAEGDYRRIADLEKAVDNMEKKSAAVESKLSALYVTHGIILIALGGLATKVITGG